MPKTSKPPFVLAFFVHNNEGRFTRDDDTEDITVDLLADRLSAGVISVERAIRDAKKFLLKYPDCLELYQFLANLYFDLELYDEAIKVRAAAFERARALIPADFDGALPYSRLSLRPFLRLLHGYVLDLDRAGRHAEALELCQWSLARCPEDNLGLRYILPDLQFRLGQVDAASESYLETESSFSPASSYQLSLIRFQQKEFVLALTHLRRGFASNLYIAEMLCGRVICTERVCWDASGASSIEWAQDYIRHAGRDWTPEAIRFLDWAYNTAPVMRERAALMEYREALLITPVGPARSAIIDAARIKEDRDIDETLSQKLARPIAAQSGRLCWPWDLAALSSP